MGLTLNTNSLNLATSGASAATGLSTSDVTTLIKNNTPYQFITKLAVPASVTQMDFSNIFSATDGFSQYRIILDGVDGAQGQNHMQMFLEIDGGWITSNLGNAYGFANVRHSGTGGSYNADQASNYGWYIFNRYWENAISGNIDLSIDSNGRPTCLWFLNASHSNTQPSWTFGSGTLNTTNQCTGFRLQTVSGDWVAGGVVRVYGVNNV
jgi:hypothetical protein|tara:strand:- start:377 stop:1003 length:627 start_codon:yes stop_codon:yes gene_type:complete